MTTMNTYDRITVAKFADRLKSNMYRSVTGARRAIGKAANWSEQERTSARAIAEKHFFKTGAPAKPPPTTKTPAPAAASKKGATAKPALVPRVAQVSKATKAVKVVAAKATKPPSPVTRRPASLPGLAPAPTTNADLIELAASADKMIEGMRRVAELCPEARTELLEANKTYAECLKLILGAMRGDPMTTAAPSRVKTLETSVRAIGHAVPPQAHIGSALQDAPDADARVAAGG